MKLPTLILLLLIHCYSFSQTKTYIDVCFEKFDESKSLGMDEEFLHLETIRELILTKYNSTKNLANLYRRYGSFYKRKGNYDSATSFYITAINYSTKANDKLSTTSSLNQLGVIYYHLKKWDQSLFYFKRANTNYASINDYRGIADASGNISEIYTLVDSFDLALHFATNGLNARKKWGDTSRIGRNYYAIGFAYEKLKNKDSAIKYYTTAIERAETANDISNITQTLNGFGRTYFNIKEYDLAILYFNKALDTAYKYQNRPLLAETCGYLANAHQEKGDTLKAYKYLKLESVLKDDLLDDNKVNAIIDAERKYDSEIKTRTITEQANQIKIGRLWLVIVIIVSISIVVIAFLLIRGYRNRQRMAQKEIDEQRRRVDDLMQKQEVENVNAMLKGQDEERKLIAQELHDRIGSILSTVKLHFTNVETGIALLKEQQNKSYTEAVGLLDEAVDEVRRISHDLYEGSLAKFGFKTALLQLIAAIEKANVVHVTFMDNGIERNAYKEFEQDLYRITQELLSNSLKYAQAKEITIQLNQKQSVVEYMYEDSGIGFNPQKIQTSTGIGYKNIAARVAKMGGTWHLDAHPNHGMTLIIELPIDYGKD